MTKKRKPIKDDVLTASLGAEEEETQDGVRKEEEKTQEEVTEPEPEETIESEVSPKEVEEAPSEETPKAEEPKEEPEPEKLVAKRGREVLERENKAIKDELTDLRAKYRELQHQQARFQAPTPIPSQAPAVAMPQVSQADDLFELQFREDGKTGIPRSSLREMIAQEVAQATQIPPEQQLQQAIETETARWINEDPENRDERIALAQYARNAAEFLQEHTKIHELSTGQSAQTVSGWVNIMEQSGIADQFRKRFTEIPDLSEFSHAFFSVTPIEDKIQSMLRYMDRYVEKAPSIQQEQIPTEVKPSAGVIPLASKPRSMAKKGTVKPAKTPKLSRLAFLQHKAAVETVDMTKAEWQELRELSEQEGAA